ncbi:MAG: hypothetical protein OEV78_06655 [Spirochaetia bacterium]|nr:hypothetical protein [Spirochaetia bacterium]
MNKIVNLLKRVPVKIWKNLWNVTLTVIVVFALIISLMPIIAWYAGLFGLFFLIFQWVKIRKDSDSPNKILSINEIKNIKHGKITLYIILFGLLIHGSCRVHSQILVNNLYNEAIHEKNIILTNVENK